MRRRPAERGPDGIAAKHAPRSELAARDRQAHVESRHDATNPLLEVPQAHAVRTRSMRALRVRVRRWHGWGLRERAQVEASHDLAAERVLLAAEAHAPRDRRGPPPCERGHDVVAGPPAGERALRPPVPMPVVRTVRLGAIHRVRLRRAIRSDVRRHVLMSGMRVARSVGCGLVPGLRPRLRPNWRNQRLRVRMPAVRRPRLIRRGSLLLWRLV